MGSPSGSTRARLSTPPIDARAPRIGDPRVIPVVGTGAHLPALPPHALSPVAIARRFINPPASYTPEFARDLRSVHSEGRSLTPASVLVPLVQREAGLTVLLTRRTDHLHDHPGQISFPGGRQDPQDADATAAALREAAEEVGLAAQHVKVLGCMPHYITTTQYLVTPVVALVEPSFSLNLDAFEVAEAFEVPLAFLMNPANHQVHQGAWSGSQRQFLSMPWRGIGSAGVQREFFIWGATAAMLRNFYGYLAMPNGA